jgi:hypothetical protein
MREDSVFGKAHVVHTSCVGRAEAPKGGNVKVVTVFLPLSVAANLGLLYLLLDAGVTTTHQADAREAIERGAAACLDVVRVDWVGRGEPDVTALPDRLKGLGRPARDVYLRRDGDVLAVLDLRFRVRGGKVAEVSYYGDTLLDAASKGPRK